MNPTTDKKKNNDAKTCNSYEYDLLNALAFADRDNRDDLSMLYHFVDLDMISKRYPSTSETLKELETVYDFLKEHGIIKRDTVDIPRLVSIIKALLEMHHALKYEIFDKILERQKKDRDYNYDDFSSSSS